MNKMMSKMIMYHEIHRFSREGLKPAQISRKVLLDTRTVKKILSMSEPNYVEYLESQQTRDKILDPYEGFVKSRLESCPEASAAQVHDWLKEHFDELPGVTEKTVFNFVLCVRARHGIPKSFNHRDYEKVGELPYGEQTQVDFGEYNMTTDQGTRKKIYFICFVLSRSRQKYSYHSERPFTTMTAIIAHEEAIGFFEGITEYFVYDQDTLLLVDENKGDLVMTEAFRKYAEYRGFKVHFCRKSDPQSKGKVENVVKYHKYNFFRGRIFVNINVHRSENIAWLKRTANAKVHSTTRKIPHEEWLIEKQYLQPVIGSYDVETTPDRRDVSKDNVISYRGNFYRVPRGTYNTPKTTVRIEVGEENRLIIYDVHNRVIANHAIYPGRGKTVGGSQYTRDYTKRIDELIDETSGQFTDPERVKEYFFQIRKDKPRYIRDQILIVKKLTGVYHMKIIEQALDFCIANKIYRATDLESVVKRVLSQQSQKDTVEQPVIIKTINQTAYKIMPDKSDISDYQSLMN
jgi:hypothetical protein